MLKKKIAMENIGMDSKFQILGNTGENGCPSVHACKALWDLSTQDMLILLLEANTVWRGSWFCRLYKRNSSFQIVSRRARETGKETSLAEAIEIYKYKHV